MELAYEKVTESFLEEDTHKLGFEMGSLAKGGDIYLLFGDLGVGKTVFAKGFAKGLGIDENITSPTFTILCEYEGRLPLYHFDMYRIEDADELYDIGYEEYFFGEGVCLVEWPEKMGDLMPDTCTSITINKDQNLGDDYRKITIKKY